MTYKYIVVGARYNNIKAPYTYNYYFYLKRNDYPDNSDYICISYAYIEEIRQLLEYDIVTDGSGV